MLNNANDIKVSIFNFNNNQVRAILIDGEPWFVAKDVADILEYEKPSKMYERLDEDEKKTTTLQFGASSQNAIIINESGLYNAVLGSKKENAKHFKKWVTSEVLPSIRKTGSYTKKPLTPAELLLAQAQLIVNMEKRQIELESNQDLQHKEILKLQNTINRNITSNNFTVIAYANLNKIKPSQYRASQLGRYASKLCREKGLVTGLVVDSKYGAIKTYPADILEETFKNFGL